MMMLVFFQNTIGVEAKTIREKFRVN